MIACSGGSDDAAPGLVGDSGVGSIDGTVTSLNGEPVVEVRVAIVSGTASFPEIAPETDEAGHYQIGGVSPGTFEVAVYDSNGQSIGQASATVTSGETATLDFSVSTVAGGDQGSPASAKIRTDGLCLPAVPLAVSLGDTWTISGTVKDPQGIASDLPAEAAHLSRIFVVDAIGSTTHSSGRDDTPIEHPTIQLEITNVTRDADGSALSAEDDPRAARGSWTPASVTNLGPALTPDWECHRNAWLNGWNSPTQPSISEGVLSSGVTAVVFTVR